MLAASLLAIFLVPPLFVLVERIRGDSGPSPAPPHGAASPVVASPAEPGHGQGGAA